MKAVPLLLLILLYCLSPAFAADAHWLDQYRADETLFNEQGYRIARYRTPTPEFSQEATLLSTRQLADWLDRKDKPLLLDVLPLDTFGNEFVQSEPRFNIPGSLWLPNVGRGDLSPQVEAYYKRGLQTLTEGDKHRSLVIYCRADCWMSWNAVKRARAWGYTRLYWYRDGMSGWREANLPEHESLPMPLGHEE